jgi:hypothetical protein
MARMLAHPQTANRVSGHKARRFEMGPVLFEAGRVVLIALLFLFFFYVAHSMVAHRFFDGGWYNRNGTIRP